MEDDKSNDAWTAESVAADISVTSSRLHTASIQMDVYISVCVCVCGGLGGGGGVAV